MVLWAMLSWRPVFPIIDLFFARSLAAIAGFLAMFICVNETQADHDDTSHGLQGIKKVCQGLGRSCFFGASWFASQLSEFKVWLRHVGATAYVKIYIAYFQILGTFGMFSAIEWPVGLKKLIEFSKGVFRYEASLSHASFSHATPRSSC